jgi:hypothetical protein
MNLLILGGSLVTICFRPIPTQHARALQEGGRDAYGRAPEVRVSDGEGIPCRHCLGEVAKGERYLVLAYTPFETLQPYAETGPIFLHADRCPAYAETHVLPKEIGSRSLVLMKAYDARDRIVYGKGCLIKPDDITGNAGELFEDSKIAYLHVRSAYNNCYSFRIDRG